MSETKSARAIGMAEGEARNSGFNPRVMLWVIGAGIVAFAGFLVLSAYAPEMRAGQDGRSHALSQAAVGYAGIVRLREELEHENAIIRSKDDLGSEDLLVLTPELGTDPESLAGLVRDRGAKPTLIVLPKRVVGPDFRHPGWVFGREIADTATVERLLKDIGGVRVSQRRLDVATRFESDWAPDVPFGKGAVVQSVSGEKLEIYIDDGRGGALLAGLVAENAAENSDYASIYILADPDIVNNLGIGSKEMARAANAILDELSDADTQRIDFDVTLNGLETSRGLLKLAFEPPFLALTLSLLAAALMALAHGLMRFGPPLRERPAIAPGKGALVANTGDLIKLAGLEHETGGRYAGLTRDLAAHTLGLPAGISVEVADQRLDRLSRDGFAFTELARRSESAGNSYELLAAARALFQWRKEKTG